MLWWFLCVNCCGMKTTLETAYSPEDFRENAHRVVNLLADHLEESINSEKMPAIKWIDPEEHLEFWKADFNSPNAKDPVDLFKAVMERSVNLHNPKYIGHQVSATLPVTVLSAALIAYLNQGVSVYDMGMAGNAMEKIMIEHLASKFGYGKEAAGIITSGGTLANLTALLTARSRFGEEEYSKLIVLVSGEAHYSIERAVKIMGLPADNLIKVPVDGNFRMRVDALDELYRTYSDQGKKVLCVIGCACSTSLGVYDDLEAIGQWANKRDIWFHVDGAHGAAAIYSPKYKTLLKGIEWADSIILDFHKLLMAPSLSTALIYKDGKSGIGTFTQKADYLFQSQQEDQWYNPGKRTFECTKTMSVLNSYTVLRMYGEELHAGNIDTVYDLAREFSSEIEKHDAFELAIRPMSNIVCFRLRVDGDSDKVNKGIADRLLADGRFYIVNTVVNGEFWFRITIQNPLTTLAHLMELLDYILILHKDDGKLQEV